MASAFHMAARRGGQILIVTACVNLGIPGISFAQQGTPQQGTPVPPGETERRIEQQRTLNEALEQRIRNLEEELASDVCAALDQQGPEACLEPSPLIDFSRPAVNPDSGDGAALNPVPSTPSAPPADEARIDESRAEPAPETANVSNAAIPMGNLQSVERLEQVTAFIMTKTGSSGSGFLVGDGLMMTNQHVIDGVAVGEQDAILITSSALGQPYLATVIATTPKAEPGTADFALLRVEGLSGNPTIDITRTVGKLDTVLAAGYPGLVVSNDRNLMDFMDGNADVAPDLVLSSGEVSALQQSGNGIPVIVHTASISSGNSGGPLMDRCGRIVGINTFITADQETASRAGFALSSREILNFSEKSGVALVIDDRVCPAP